MSIWRKTAKFNIINKIQGVVFRNINADVNNSSVFSLHYVVHNNVVLLHTLYVSMYVNYKNKRLLCDW